ncbi:glycosyltransferase family 4 protein [Zhihengliuella flava]|uniref:Glycosyltransferase involved in cell wall biosynthesis n=1 Tax=Zhihengliuella flava TaxID=1285193 RepID=A0A931DDF6_9MICC|nr:glycosyltransferase family 1 protein [Zhihengliuella flava]MBG6085436.1 glycosyltransferase involved in cell wall biosynthesis [Zhihengliuella flava]
MKIYMPSRIIDRHVGGNTTYARRLASGLVSRGYDIARIPAGRHPALTMVSESMFGLLPKAGSSVLHYVADTGPLLRQRMPTVVTVHGVASNRISGVRNPRAETIWRARVGRAIASTDEVITVSESSAQDIVDVFGVERDRINVIRHGMETHLFSTPQRLSDQMTAKIPREFVLYLGNIEPRKNVDNLVAAFSTPEVSALGVPLVIAGKPAWDADDTMKKIEAAANIIYLGFVSDEDRVALMQQAQVFAFPSRYEGFGFPVLEALAAGSVVITSRAGSLAEVAGPSLVFDSLDVDGVAHGIVRALTDTVSRHRVEREGLAWAESFSWEASITAHESVYNRANIR